MPVLEIVKNRPPSINVPLLISRVPPARTHNPGRARAHRSPAGRPAARGAPAPSTPKAARAAGRMCRRRWRWPSGRARTARSVACTAPSPRPRAPSCATRHARVTAAAALLGARGGRTVWLSTRSAPSGAPRTPSSSRRGCCRRNARTPRARQSSAPPPARAPPAWTPPRGLRAANLRIGFTSALPLALPQRASAPRGLARRRAAPRAPPRGSARGRRLRERHRQLRAGSVQLLYCTVGPALH